MQGVIDAASSNPELRQEIDEWVGTEDYDEVIEMSGMSPIFVTNVFEEVLSERDYRAAFRKAMKFRHLVKGYLNKIGAITKPDKDDVDQ